MYLFIFIFIFKKYVTWDLNNTTAIILYYFHETTKRYIKCTLFVIQNSWNNYVLSIKWHFSSRFLKIFKNTLHKVPPDVLHVCIDHRGYKWNFQSTTRKVFTAILEKIHYTIKEPIDSEISTIFPQPYLAFNIIFCHLS